MSAISRLLARLTTPETTPISSELQVGLCVHLPPPHLYAEISRAGFDLITVDGIPDWWLQMASVVAAKREGLRVWAGHEMPDWSRWPSAPATLEGYKQKMASWWSAFGPVIDFSSSVNESDLHRFVPKGVLMDDLVPIYEIDRRYQQKYAPNVKILGPSLTTLGSSSNRGWKNTAKRLSELGCRQYWDIVAFHVYQDSPSATWDKAREAISFYKSIGWNGPYAVTEFGYKSRGQWFASEETQARFLVNTLTRLGNLGVVMVQIYEAADAPGGGYGIYTQNLKPKRALQRLSTELSLRKVGIPPA